MAHRDPRGFRTSNVYDAAGRRTRLADANNKLTTFLFNALSRDLGSIDPLLRRVTFGYDAAGNRLFELDPRGIRATYVYDAVYRVTAERYSNGTNPRFCMAGGRLGALE
jgi:YD repeat-containing protein